MIQLNFFTSPDYLTSDKHSYPLFSRIVPRSEYQIVAILDLLTYLYTQSNIEKYLHVGIICSANEYGINGAKSMIKLAPKYDVVIEAYQQFLSAFSSGTAIALNCSVEINELKNSGSRVFVGIMQPLDFTNVINTAAEFEIIGPDYVWICVEGCASPFAYLNLYTKEIDFTTREKMNGIIGINQSGFKGEKYEELANEVLLMDKTIFPVDFIVPTLQFQYIYDGVFFLATAIAKMIEEEGFTEDGKLIDKVKFMEILLNTTYVGATGLIQLTSEGDRIPTYDIVNLQSNLTEFTIVGNWNLKDGLKVEKEIEFYGRSTVIPDIDIRLPFAYWSCENKQREVDFTGKTVDLKTPNGKKNANIDYDYYCDQFIDCENLSDESSGDCATNYSQLFIIFGSITAALILFAIFYLLITIIFGLIIKRKIFISASPLFLMIILISCLVGYASIFAWYGKPNKIACGFQPWLLGLPVISMISALCAKTFRIWRIFKSPFKRNVITDFELLVLWFIMILPGIIILSLWTLISTPTTHMKSFDGEEHFVCDTGGFTGTPGGYVFFFIFVGYSAIILLFGAFLSKVTRDVPALFNESKLISISIYHLVFLSIVIIPIVIVLNDIDPFISWIIRTTGILYAFTATLWIQFVPKIISLIFIDHCKNTSSQTKSLSQLSASNTGNSGQISHIPEANSNEIE